ncbi:hypothetical protein V8G54_023644 [Vigna mungo]|uniref:Retrotransposon gag domain-containing protein n=1 Tax=Vigna mungo TaxID=3915 RepID=A0AAQ3RRT6_VIGMU
MAEHNTRSKTIDGAILHLTQNQSVLTTAQNELNSKLDSIIARLSQVNHTSPKSQSPPSSSSMFFKPHMNLEVPQFDGHDATGWIFKITQFFEYHSTPEEDRLKFQWVQKNGMIPSWSIFLHALETRFAPSYYEDPCGLLFKLTQSGTVNDYLTEFEQLASRVMGLPPSFLLSCFVSGLSPEIKREVLTLQPLTFTQAAALAKLQEDKFHYAKRPPASLSVLATPDFRFSVTASRALFFPSATHTFQDQLQETFSRGNVCVTTATKSSILATNARHETEVDSTTLSDSLAPPDPDPLHAHDVQNELSSAQISFNAHSGLPAPEALRLLGRISKKQVTVLVDGGSTHNFIQDREAKFLNLPLQPTPTLKVMIDNGSVIKCHQFCPAVPISIQGHIFTVDLHVLPINGADVVLSIQWLKTLSPIVTDYSQMTMRFDREGRTVELSATSSSSPQDISAHQLKRLFQTNSVAAYFHIQISPTSFPSQPTTATLPTHSHPQLSSLLHKYQSLFLFPTSLPPTRQTDHHIHLLPNSSPVTVRPYRYPHFQKCEIEKQIEEVLHIGLIHPTLNSISVKDKFPLPTIDELLDELGGARWFSKLDLRQGFHQI